MLFNRPRALDFMRSSGLDVLIATSPVNVTYFSDYFCWLDPLLKEYMTVPGGGSGPALPSYAVFPVEGRAIGRSSPRTGPGRWCRLNDRGAPFSVDSTGTYA